ncbi:MAG: bifunctional diaminohydroxyphosphoribosylaminopyrimidine deaminase/5-amino-6-(5-phosphoribosylamino)uracil reductase RibD [Gemmatimonadetes bacterium]|nr:bifunctional diaminohydroxyphosphoribosylaminopyrimidine deaminase/5-amino-6-(5-phosphoribosylamino)uracil reductase RibD [Gemmatimonadota bacterium]
MRRALALAARGWGRVCPNPLVGAVVVRDGQVVGEGFHGSYGGAHAEVEALRAAADRARGATLYVTLEPCNHHGKTPPCTEAILRAGVRRVVYAVADPTAAAGGGAERLRGEGIEVESGLCAEEAHDLNAVFFTASVEQRTYVCLKLALSLDARIAEAPGRRTAISGPRAIREAHRLRAGYDALAVGIGTVLSDDPLLTVREWPVPSRPPVRIVLDSQLRTPLVSRLVATTPDALLWLLAGRDSPRARRDALESRGARIIAVGEAAPGRLDLREVLQILWGEGIHSVLFEGGSALASSLLAERLVDRLELFYAPTFLGPEALPAFRAGPPERWRLAARRALGPDTLLSLVRAT